MIVITVRQRTKLVDIPENIHYTAKASAIPVSYYAYVQTNTTYVSPAVTQMLQGTVVADASYAQSPSLVTSVAGTVNGAY